MKGERKFEISLDTERSRSGAPALLARQLGGTRYGMIDLGGYTPFAPEPIEVVEVPPSLEPDKTGRTYEVFVEVHHHLRHNEDWGKQLSDCWKLVDTGKPREMIANCLWELADKVEAGKRG